MTTATQSQAQRIITPLRELYDQACTLEVEQSTQVAAIDPAFQNSARNLLHYLAVRQHDLCLLNGVLERMSAHQAKKRSMLRKLSVSQVH